MADPLETVTDVVAKLGGAKAVQAMFGCKTVNTVYNWTAENRLPARTYPAIKQALASKAADAPDHLWNSAVAAVEPARQSA